jgi:hypothetical protein
VRILHLALCIPPVVVSRQPRVCASSFQIRTFAPEPSLRKYKFYPVIIHGGLGYPAPRVSPKTMTSPKRPAPVGHFAGCLYLMLLLLCSCAYRPPGFRILADQGLRLGAADPCFVRASSASKDQQGCGPVALQRILGADLRAAGIPAATDSQAKYELLLACRDLFEPPRNQPPVAPGSRLWYQRRFYAPTFAKRSIERADGARQLELTVYPGRAGSKKDQAPLFRATVVSRDGSEDAVEAAVQTLVHALSSSEGR